MEIIILGFVLFILGIGATIAYDKHKENQKNKPVFDPGRYVQTNSRPLTKPPTKSKPAPASKPTSFQDILRARGHGTTISAEEFMELMNGRNSGTLAQHERQLKEVSEELESLTEVFGDIFEDDK